MYTDYYLVQFNDPESGSNFEFLATKKQIDIMLKAKGEFDVYHTGRSKFVGCSLHNDLLERFGVFGDKDN